MNLKTKKKKTKIRVKRNDTKFCLFLISNYLKFRFLFFSKYHTLVSKNEKETLFNLHFTFFCLRPSRRLIKQQKIAFIYIYQYKINKIKIYLS